MWEISVSGQVFACTYSIILGAILSVFYDVIRITRKAGANSFAAVFIGDILFWLVSAVLVFIFLVSVTNGEIRGYVIFFCVVGFLLYRFTVGRILFGMIYRLFTIALKLLHRFSVLLSRFCSAMEKLANKNFLRIRRLLSGAFSHIKKLLKSAYNMLYTKKHKSKMEHDVNE